MQKRNLLSLPFFLHEGIPQFDVHLNGRYVSPKDSHTIDLNKWTHLAGVYDGKKVQLFVNGELVQSLESSGERTLNDLPLYIGADPNGLGNPTRPFAGRIDEVRISKGARYTEVFHALQRFEQDKDTLLLLHLDQAYGPLLFDSSPRNISVRKLAPSRISER